MIANTTDRPIVRFADQVGSDGTVAVEGGRTRWSKGGCIERDTRLLSAPAGIVEHVPAEMIVRVRAGTLVSELHAALGAHHQRTALPDRGGTVGGAIAVGENDLLIGAFGRLRASVLQIRYASADGQLITGGGRTVKNVAGYDLPRLMTGSLGTLGLIAEVTLRTMPLPHVTEWVTTNEIDPHELIDGWRPHAAVLWDGSRSWFCLTGHRADVDAERRRLDDRGRFDEVAGPPPLPEHRWSLRPSDIRTLSRPELGGFVAVVGRGLVFAEREQPHHEHEPVLERLQQRIKDNFDPTHRLNPGRRPGA